MALMAEFTNRAGMSNFLSAESEFGVFSWMSHRGAAANLHPYSGLEELLGPRACRTAELWQRGQRNKSLRSVQESVSATSQAEQSFRVAKMR